MTFQALQFRDRISGRFVHMFSLLPASEERELGILKSSLHELRGHAKSDISFAVYGKTLRKLESESHAIWKVATQ